MVESIRAILPHHRARKKGVIINISSGAGVFALSASTLYGASKFALEGFSKALAYELAPLGITVKIVEPGIVLDTGYLRRAYEERDAKVAIDDRRLFATRAAEIFSNRSAKRQQTSCAQVASATFDAVVDGTETLRYIPTPDILEQVTLRREAGEERYMQTCANILSSFVTGASCYPEFTLVWSERPEISRRANFCICRFLP